MEEKRYQNRELISSKARKIKQKGGGNCVRLVANSKEQILKIIEFASTKC